MGKGKRTREAKLTVLREELAHWKDKSNYFESICSALRSESEHLQETAHNALINFELKNQIEMGKEMVEDIRFLERDAAEARGMSLVDYIHFYKNEIERERNDKRESEIPSKKHQTPAEAGHGTEGKPDAGIRVGSGDSQDRPSDDDGANRVAPEDAGERLANNRGEPESENDRTAKPAEAFQGPAGPAQ